MANNANKKIIVKKDMNFFAEFTASAAKAARLLTYAILFGAAVVGVILIFIVIGLVRNAVIRGQIADLEAQLASPEYANLETQAAALAETLKIKNNYFYALSQMRKNVDETPAVPMELPDVIEKDIPSDSYLIQYDITGTTLLMEGYSFTIARVSATEIGTPEDYFPEDNVVNGINNYYQFQIGGTLVNDVFVSIERFASTDTVSSIGGIQVDKYSVGTTYTYDNIGTYEAGGVSYTLSSVTVNGVGIDEESLNNIIAAGAISGVANDNVDIALYYTPVETAGAEETAAEAQ